ncbi:integrase [Terrihabitans rhizophilus]|uniref:Integrase n=1 Tax=Terrihabitans rhizophilus TaxID=3092662 RepID=A0ABU4RRP8_9HYPH|nr:integrase [Terrihabitans sp. PJ23]MDX6806350.1 integrase [Terrihabitans sp. PJ23]
MALGYESKIVRIAGDDGDVVGRALIAQEAGRLSSDAAAWLDQQRTGSVRYDGSLGALVRLYQNHDASPYHELKWNTRRTYDHELKLISTAFGKRQLAALKIDDFRRWYAEAKTPAKPGGVEHVRKAHGIINMLRRIFAFGVTAEVPQCNRLDAILARARFKQPAPSREKLTRQQVEAFIPRARAAGRLSLAIGTALQFESTFRQRDVIGEWEPIPAGTTPSGIVLNKRRWTLGITWGDIRPDWTLEKLTSKNGQFVGHDLKLYPMTLALLMEVPEASRIGPLIMDEVEGRPYAEFAYAREWRVIATEAGIPKTVWNMHARAGGISEGDEAGADLDAIGHQSGQTLRATTARYVRGTIEKTRKVANLRNAHVERGQNGG